MQMMYFFYLQIKFIQRLQFHYICLVDNYYLIYFFNETSQASVKSDDYKRLHAFQWLSSFCIFFFFSYQNIFVVVTKGKLLLIPAAKSTGRQRLTLDYYRECSGKNLEKMLACFIFVLKILKSTLSQEKRFEILMSISLY